MTYLQIVAAEILLCIPVCFSLSRRTGLLSPASAAANFCLSCLIFAFIVWWQQVDLWALRVGGIAFPVTASQQANVTATYIYTFVILLTYCSAWKIRRKPVPFAVSLNNALTKQASKLARRAMAIHSVLAPFVATVAASHLFLFLLPNLDSYYFTDRSNILLAPLLLVAMIAGYYSLRLSRKIYFFLYLATFLYAFTISLGAYSRTIPLSFIVLAVCIAVDPSIKKPWLRYSLAPFCTLMGVYFLLYALVGRSGRDAGLDYGLVWQAMKDAADPANSSLLLAATTNVFHGVLLLAECIDTTGVSYSGIYQILSLSPFPSAIDGWNDVIDQQIRINIYTPFNTFAELYFFAAIPQLAFIITYFYCVRTMTRFYTNNIGWRRAFITAFSLMCWVIMQQYPVRNMFRILLVAAVLCFLMRVRRPKTKVRGRAPYRGGRTSVPQLQISGHGAPRFSPSASDASQGPASATGALPKTH